MFRPFCSLFLSLFLPPPRFHVYMYFALLHRLTFHRNITTTVEKKSCIYTIYIQYHHQSQLCQHYRAHYFDGNLRYKTNVDVCASAIHRVNNSFYVLFFFKMIWLCTALAEYGVVNFPWISIHMQFHLCDLYDYKYVYVWCYKSTKTINQKKKSSWKERKKQ